MAKLPKHVAKIPTYAGPRKLRDTTSGQFVKRPQETQKGKRS